MDNQDNLKSLDNKVFIPDADYGLSRVSADDVTNLFIACIIVLQLGVLGIAGLNGWLASLRKEEWFIIGIVWVSIVLALSMSVDLLITIKFDDILKRTGGTKLAIIDNKVYEFYIDRVTGDEEEALDVGKIKEIIDKAGNKQTAKDWIIENILRAVGRDKQINLADVSIPLPGETEISKDMNKEHIELSVNKCEILNINKSEREDSIEVAYRYDFDDNDDKDIDDEDIECRLSYKPRNFVRFADGSLSGYKELVDSLEKIARKQ